MDAQPREAEGTAFGRSGGDAKATDGRERWRFTSACSGELARAVPTDRVEGEGADPPPKERAGRSAEDDSQRLGQHVGQLRERRECWERDDRRRYACGDLNGGERTPGTEDAAIEGELNHEEEGPNDNGECQSGTDQRLR